MNKGIDERKVRTMKKRSRIACALLGLLLTLTIALCACTGDKAADASSSITIGIP
ncbi:MAG: hypothetical protein IKY53_04385 [Lachnospiraceae bacterium]|nr:hypothetical protein [Lachnospiraceae bacterium]